jgi:hypothetical protein
VGTETLSLEEKQPEYESDPLIKLWLKLDGVYLLYAFIALCIGTGEFLLYV